MATKTTPIKKTAKPVKKSIIKSIMERCVSFETALKISGESMASFKNRTQFDSIDEIAYKKLKVIVMVLNEGWVPDFTNGSQLKYFNWFYVSSSGVAFSVTSFVYSSTHTGAGSRLYFKTRSLAEYAAKNKKILKIYEEYLIK